MKLSDDIRNARLDVIQTAIGPAPTLEILTSESEVICSGSLPSNWLTKAENGQVSKAGVWEVLSSQSSGKPALYRISGQGSEVSGDISRMKISRQEIKKGQTVVVDEYSISEGNG